MNCSAILAFPTAGKETRVKLLLPCEPRARDVQASLHRCLTPQHPGPRPPSPPLKELSCHSSHPATQICSTPPPPPPPPHPHPTPPPTPPPPNVPTHQRAAPLQPSEPPPPPNTHISAPPYAPAPPLLPRRPCGPGSSPGRPTGPWGCSRRRSAGGGGRKGGRQISRSVEVGVHLAAGSA
jgi:hypothetical protein